MRLLSLGVSMRRRAFIGFSLLALSHFAFANVTAALAQAGSTGGTIGKTDKSLSGNEETPARRPNGRSAKATPASSSLPSTIHINEHNATQGEFSATLKRTGSNTYEAVWKHGLISRMTVTIGRESMTIERNDLTGGCHAHYTGTRVPGTSKASGEDTGSCPLGSATSTWDA